jgi:nucleotide-binding universal stress UspA family protein
MIKHLLIPLDGSRLAEAALPVGAYLAPLLGAQVTLVHVIERDAPREIHGERHLADVAGAQAYLDQAAAQWLNGLPCTTHVHEREVRDVAASIAGHVDELGLDLIVMCTHGWGGLQQWLYGSIAQQIVGMGVAPVWVVHPQEGASTQPFSCRHILVPLDGNAQHEQALPLAVELARVCSASLDLLGVVQTLGTLSGERAASARVLPGTTAALLDMAQQELGQHLQGLAQRLAAQSEKVSIHVARGAPESKIVSTARHTHADLIVMGTHGKAGMEAFWGDHVPPKVSSRSKRAVLLVPVPAA